MTCLHVPHENHITMLTADSCRPQDHGLPYTLVPHPNRTVAAIQVKEGVVHATEELVVGSGPHTIPHWGNMATIHSHAAGTFVPSRT